MLKLIILGLEDCLLNNSNYFLLNIIKSISKKINKDLNQELVNKIDFISYDEKDFFDIFIKDLSKKWKIKKEIMINYFYEEGKNLLTNNKITLCNEWLVALNDIENHQIKFCLMSLFDVNKNPFINYKKQMNLNDFINVPFNPNLKNLKINVLNFIKQHLIQPSESLILTNRYDLFDLANYDNKFKIMSWSEKIPKDLIKNNYVIKINNDLNIESWIYNFLDKEEKTDF